MSKARRDRQSVVAAHKKAGTYVPRIVEPKSKLEQVAKDADTTSRRGIKRGVL